MDWVTGNVRHHACEFRSWSFAFSKGAKMFLSVGVYTKEDEKMDAFMNAYLRAAHLGGFDDMQSIYSSSTTGRALSYGEKIFKKLKDRYLPTCMQLKSRKRKPCKTF